MRSGDPRPVRCSFVPGNLLVELALSCAFQAEIQPRPSLGGRNCKRSMFTASVEAVCVFVGHIYKVETPISTCFTMLRLILCKHEMRIPGKKLAYIKDIEIPLCVEKIFKEWIVLLCSP